MTIRFFIIILAFIAIQVHQQVKAQSTVPDSAMQIQLSFAPVVKRITPSVVNIYTKRTVTRRSHNLFFNDPFFNHFFGSNDRDRGGRLRQQVESSLGSGVIITKEGLIATNAHVIKGADEIKIVLSDGREFDARSTVIDEPSDLALLRIVTPQNSKETFPFATIKPSSTLEVGDIVLAIGNPFGVGQSVTSGIVSAKGRSSLDINDFNFFIQTDAAINPGNSGGPLATLDGKIVGINTAIYSRSGGSLGIGFAIPSEMLNSVIAAEASSQSVPNRTSRIIRPWLGVTAQNVTSEIADSLGLSSPRGMLIANLHSESPLKRAGMKIGDVVTAIDGYQIRDSGELKFRMATVPMEKHAIFQVIRQGQDQSFKVKAMPPPDRPDRDKTSLNGQHPLNGVIIANLNPAVAVELNRDVQDTDVEAVIVMETSRNSYYNIVRAGDIILKINAYEIANVKDVEKALKKGERRSQGWLFLINRNGKIRQVSIR